MNSSSPVVEIWRLLVLPNVPADSCGPGSPAGAAGRSAPGRVADGMPRYLHTSIFVNDMAESIEFYTAKLGLRLLDGPHHYPGNADMAFVGSSWDAYIELVYDLEEHPPYAIGNRYEHLALEVDGDLPAALSVSVALPLSPACRRAARGFVAPAGA